MLESDDNLDSISVLIVEDNPGDRRLAEFALRTGCQESDLRCDIETAETLEAALQQLQRPEYAVNVVLLDLRLPDGDGVDCVRRITEARPHVAVVALTGLSDVQVATEALKAGAVDYLEKGDVQPRSLLRSMRYAIERKRSHNELLRLARSDPLTGMLNRRAFFEQLDNALVQAGRSELACAVLVFDVDHFKEVNDVFGHKTGDDVLVEMTRRLRSTLRETDFIGRLGGDEFAVLATNLKTAAAAMEIADKIARAVVGIEEINDMRIELSASIGISVFPMDNSSAEVLVSHADLAMYKSKASKKGSINFFDTHMDEAIKARHVLKRNLPEDITSGRFYLLFQPIVDAGSRKIVGAEGLARWRDLTNRIIAPNEFIPLAEEIGSIANLGNRLVEEACSQIAGWTGQGRDVVPISLNISPLQCRDPGFAARLIASVEKSGVKPQMINIEITESTILKNFDIIQKNLEMLKAYGIGIHIDDFGTGYSSLALLKDLPLSALKIDRSFVRDLNQTEDSKVIVRAIVDLGRKLGFKTVAEGVETEEQVAILRDIGADALQGFYFAKPVPGGQLASWLAKGQNFLVA